jgi:hypothetical protein
MTEVMLWRRLDLPGQEIARLEALGDGWKLFGTAIFAYQHHPSKLDYVVICDAPWRTKSAKVKGVIGSREIDVTVTVDTNRRWHLGETERTSVEGSLDIDLGFSPPRIFLLFDGFGLPSATRPRSVRRGCRFHRSNSNPLLRFTDACRRGLIATSLAAAASRGPLK